MAELDATDCDIVGHLQVDGRMPYSQLGPLVGLSDAAARQRVNRLIAEGVIDIVAVTDPAKLGLRFQGLMGITVDDDVRKVAVELGGYDEVVYLLITAGRFDLMAEVLCHDNDGFLELCGAVRNTIGVKSVELIPYLDITKQTLHWGAP